MSTVSEGEGVRAWIRRLWLSGREAFRDLRERISREPSVRIMALLAAAAFLLSLGVYAIERAKAPPGPHSIHDFWQAMYWMFVSGTTTGYGDLVPQTQLGRFLAVLIIVASMIFTSFLTASIASYFVEKRLLEGKGMEKIPLKNHIVVCGWNVNGPRLLEGIYRDTADGASVVLVNNLSEEHISEVLYTWRRQNLRFVRGDFVHESILDKASVGHARSVVILADGELAGGYAGADERTVLCALAVKSVNPQVKVCAELTDRLNVGHMRRAQVDHIVVMGDHDGFFLSSAVNAPGVTLAMDELLSREAGPLIQQTKVPLHLVDQDFKALCQHFREKRGAIVIGVVSEETKGMTLDDILSDDMSAIDVFIKRQFEGMEGDYFSKTPSMKVKINPPDSYKICKNDVALIIAGTDTAGTASGGQ